MYRHAQNSLKEDRLARVLEASRYGGPMCAGLLALDEKRRGVVDAAEQRRLLLEAGVDPPVDATPIFQRISTPIQRLLARVPTPKSTISTPDHA